MHYKNLVPEFAVLIKYIIAVLLTMFRKKTLWLISERGVEARDNGYVFFLFMKKYHPTIPCRYIIDKKHEDYRKLEKYGSDIVQHRSFQNYISIASASHLISTHCLGFIPHSRFIDVLHKQINVFHNKKLVFLQHGIIMNDHPVLYSENTHLDVFICGAKYEFEYVRKCFHYTNDEVKYTGLCRYDNLLSFKNKKQILIMPTWRKYIDDSKFVESEYFIKYRDLLTNKRFHEIIRSNNFEAVFYPHFKIQKHIDQFKHIALPSFIKIADFRSDVQQLLKESCLLITDFSSVVFDMLYMNKPVLLYQFDEKTFREKHYNGGYLNYEDIGRKSTCIENLMDDLEFYFSNGFQIEEKYKPYIDGMFLYRDVNNCKRVYERIRSCH